MGVLFRDILVCPYGDVPKSPFPTQWQHQSPSAGKSEFRARCNAVIRSGGYPMKLMFLSMAATAALLAYVAPATADLIGTQVSGSAQENGVGTNFFDPVNGFVPAGFGNSSSPNNVVISASQTEFGFGNQPAITVTADFTGNSLDLKYVLVPQAPGEFVGPVTFTFTDTAFAAVLDCRA
jgi:hypothetical protein